MSTAAPARERNPLTTRTLLTCAAIGVAAGLLLGPVTLWATVANALIPLLYMSLVGLWVLGPVVALDLLRKPGVAFITSLVVGVIQMAFGGPIAIVTLLMIGVLLEIPFALGLYRYWARWVHYAAAVVLFALYGWSSFTYFAMETQSTVTQVVFYGLTILSGVAAVTIALLISARLRRAGLGAPLAGESASVAPAPTESTPAVPAE